METKKYLIEKQPIVYQIIKNAFKNDKTSHAYIICGSKGSPVLETAKFMAKSFVCLEKDENNLACERCLNCDKIEREIYADYRIINGQDLKAGVPLAIQEEFNKSSIEKENVKIYIIHLIEKAPIESLSKLLKFIEEPDSNIKAIFTSNSLSSVLPTIVSRCQIINLKEFMIKDLIDYLMNNGISKEDASLISKISNNSEKNLEIVQSERYLQTKEILSKSLDYLASKDNHFIVYMQLEAIKDLLDNDAVDLYLDMLETCLFEAIIKKEDKSYDSSFFDLPITEISNKYDHIDDMINDITSAKIDLLSNANKNLVFDKMLIQILRR